MIVDNDLLNTVNKELTPEKNSLWVCLKVGDPTIANDENIS